MVDSRGAILHLSPTNLTSSGATTNQRRKSRTRRPCRYRPRSSILSFVTADLFRLPAGHHVRRPRFQLPSEHSSSLPRAVASAVGLTGAGDREGCIHKGTFGVAHRGGCCTCMLLLLVPALLLLLLTVLLLLASFSPS